MFTIMKRNVALIILGIAVALGFTACAGDTDRKPAGPVSETSKIPWNTAIPGQGQGQLGQMPSNKYYR